MKRSEIYAPQIEAMRNGIIKEIRLLLESNNITKIEIPEINGDVVPVVCFDEDGYPFECGVTKVILRKKYIIVVATEYESDSKFRIDSRHDLGARNLDWLVAILEKIENILL